MNQCHLLKRLKSRRNVQGGYVPVYCQFLHEIRTRVKHRFASADDQLKVSIEEVKKEVATIFIGQGRLSNITYLENSSDTLIAIAESLPVELQRFKHAFLTLAKFELHGFIPPRIRRYLDRLIPDQAPFSLSSFPSTDEVAWGLTVGYAETIYELGTALDTWLSELNEIIYAVVEDFGDQIFRSSNAETEWQLFYRSIGFKVWPNILEPSNARELFLASIDQLIQAEQSNSFQILNSG